MISGLFGVPPHILLYVICYKLFFVSYKMVCLNSISKGLP